MYLPGGQDTLGAVDSARLLECFRRGVSLGLRKRYSMVEEPVRIAHPVASEEAEATAGRAPSRSHLGEPFFVAELTDRG